MATVKNPKSFAEYFKVDPGAMDRLGILNPILNVDTKLFIDPVILKNSGQTNFGRQANASFETYFSEVITLLKASKITGDSAWREAQRRLHFREIPGTCLGYGSADIRGSAFGPFLSGRLIATAKEIIDLGVDDPDLFKLLPLFEDGVGPDLISDMTTNIILKDIIQFTASACNELGVITEQFKYKGEEVRLPRNPTQSKPTSVLLVPKDILRDLPFASDWSEVADVISANANIRARVNAIIGNIWRLKTRQQKIEIRRRILSSKKAFETLLDVISETRIEAYDIERDPKGLVEWHKVHESVAKEYPLRLTLSGPPKEKNAIDLVCRIIEQFKTLVENKGIWKALWNNGVPRNEKNAQMVFFAIADTYCKLNNLDVTPEADTGSGPVDFKFSVGYKVRILVEIKLSNNPHLLHGYTKQLEVYKEAEVPVSAYYLVIDVGGMGNKDKRLFEAYGEALDYHKPASEIVFVNGKRRPSASKR